VRFWCAFEVVRPADDTLMVTCRQSLALIQMPDAKPLRLPAEWSERYAHLRA
jgi:acyl-CoA thioesterase FadM